MTTVQLDEKTRDELFKVVASLQSKLGRRVSFDEAIMILIQEMRGWLLRESVSKLYLEVCGATRRLGMNSNP